jgi:uncharacterized protein YfaS (alpha-2-macroglobulin family)
MLYQVAFRYHLPDDGKPANDGPFALKLDFDSDEVHVGETVTVKVTSKNLRTTAAPMVMVELPIPPGFAIETDDLAKLVPTKVARFQVQSGKALLYLMGMKAEEGLVFKYRLRATMPGTVSAAPARVYEYYDPEKQAFSAGVRLTVR